MLLSKSKTLGVPPAPGGERGRDAHPPQPDENPVGLCPGPLLVGSQEVLHHGDPPTRQETRVSCKGSRDRELNRTHGRTQPFRREQAGQHSLLFGDPLYSTQRVGVADIAGQCLHQGVPDVWGGMRAG